MVSDLNFNNVVGSIFAYGQTGSGKSFTMMGEQTDNLKGIIPRAVSHVFNYVSSHKGGARIHEVSCSYLEIYNEKILDLLVDEIIPDQANIQDLGLKGKPIKPRHLKIKDDPASGIFVKDLTTVPVQTEAHIF